MGQSKTQNVNPEKVEEINGQLADLSKLIFPEYAKLAYVHVDDLREQELNARSMSKAMFSQLAENIANSGMIESVPLCADVDGTIWIVSGHHRIRAARAAGQQYALVIVASGLSWDQIRAKQLAHNSIEGADDPELVKQIFEKIKSVEARFESYINPKLFDAAPKPVSFTQVDVDFKKQSRAVYLLFLPVQWADMEQAIKMILPPADVDEALICGYDEWEPWAQALKQVRQDMDVTAIPTAVAVMARLAVERMEQLAEESEHESDERDETAIEGENS